MNDKLQKNLDNGESHQGSHDSSLERHNFLNYLDTETNNLRSEIKRPGWTKYAILVAIATLSWYLINFIEIGGHSLENVALLCLTFSLLIDLIKLLFPIVRSPKLSLKLKRRFINNNVISTNKLALVLFVGQYSFFLFMALRLSGDLGTPTVVFTSIFFSLLLLGLLLVIFVIFFLKFPIRMSPPRKRLNMAINTIIILSLLVIIFRYFGFLIVSPGISSIIDIRLALITVALFYLFVRFVNVPRGSLTLDSLIMIRRELAFDEINLTTAKIQSDIALTGFRTYDVLEEYVTTLLSLYHEVIGNLREISSYLEDVETLSRDEQIGGVEQSSLARPLLETVGKLVTRVEDTGTIKIPKAFGQLHRQMFWISAQFEIPDTIREISGKISEANRILNEQLEAIHKRIQVLMDSNSQG